MNRYKLACYSLCFGSLLLLLLLVRSLIVRRFRIKIKIRESECDTNTSITDDLPNRTVPVSVSASPMYKHSRVSGQSIFGQCSNLNSASIDTHVEDVCDENDIISVITTQRRSQFDFNVCG